MRKASVEILKPTDVQVAPPLHTVGDRLSLYVFFYHYSDIFLQAVILTACQENKY